MTNTILSQFLTHIVRKAEKYISENDYLLSEKQKNDLHFRLKKASHPASSDAKLLQTDIAFIREKDPALANKEDSEVFLYKSLTLTFLHRIANQIYQDGDTTTARLLSEANREMTGAEIHPGVKIGHSIFIDHPSGLIVGETASIGNRFHGHGQVLLGSDGVSGAKKRHPTIGDDVTIWPKASILGNRHIGNNVVVGAAALITHDVPQNSTIVGHNTLVKENGEKKKISLKDYWQKKFEIPQRVIFMGD